MARMTAVWLAGQLLTGYGLMLLVGQRDGWPAVVTAQRRPTASCSQNGAA